MNTNTTKNCRKKIGATVALLALFGVQNSHATDYIWQAGAASLWTTTTAWSPNSGAEGPVVTDSIIGNTTANAIQVAGSREVGSISNASSTTTLVILGHTASSALATGSVSASQSGLTIQIRNGSGTLDVTAGNVAVSAGPTAGALYFGTSSTSTANQLRSLNVTGTTTVGASALNLNISAGGTNNLGLLNVSGGAVRLNQAPGAGVKGATTTTVAGLNGSGGVIENAANNVTAGNDSVLNIANSSDYTSATIVRNSAGGGAAMGIVSLTKNGTGTQILTAANSYTGTTTINGGALLVDGSHINGGSYTVNDGGTFGGGGTISASGLTVNDGGRLAPGGGGLANLTVNLGSGTLDISPIDTAGSLLFDLGAVESSDRITLGSGTLDVGTLSFTDFSFTTSEGFGLGTYILLDASTSIVGTLGQTSGLISGFSGELSIDSINDNIVLTVSAIPEPSSFALGLGGAAVGAVALRRRRR